MCEYLLKINCMNSNYLSSVIERTSQLQSLSRVEHMTSDKDFQLDGSPIKPVFELESTVAGNVTKTAEAQVELFLPLSNAEVLPPQPQFELDGMARPIHGVAIWSEASDTVIYNAKFQYANSLLESLEAQNIDVPYQCREGYCGGCRTQLLSGEVAYLQEPMAWINDDEVLPCCCVPKTDLVLTLKG
jgi:ferredoxin